MEEKLGEGQIDLAMLKQKQAAKDSSLYDALTEKLALEMAKAKATQGMMEVPSPRAPTTGPTAPGPKKIDELFAKEYSEFMQGGGFAKVNTQMEQLKSGIADMQKSDYISGPIVSSLPNFAVQQSNATKNKILSSTQGLLKDVLGAQFAMSEGAKIEARTFDPEAEEGVNIAAAQRFLTQIEQAKKLKEDQFAYFEANGTLAGWPGIKKMQEIQESLSGAEQKNIAGQGTSPEPLLKMTQEIYNKMSNAQKIEYKAANAAKRNEMLKLLQGK
jgi:hypothetical protein